MRASHILIGTEQATTDEAKAAALAKAEEIVALAQTEGADFAALAKEHSTGPSGPDGGDLGHFPRQGAMVEPFAAAAYELEVGGVSGVVETQFGYHIIKVTERAEGGITPLDECRDWLRHELGFQKMVTFRPQHIDALRSKATVTYTDPSDGEG